jgi:hypothetical protein
VCVHADSFTQLKSATVALLPPQLRLDRGRALFTNVVEGEFCELRQWGVLGSAHSPGPNTYARTGLRSTARGYYLDFPSSLIIQSGRVLPRGCPWPIGPGLWAS